MSGRDSKRKKTTGKKPVAQATGRVATRRPATERMQDKVARRQQRRAYQSITPAAPTTGSEQEQTQARLEQITQKMESLQQAAALADVYGDLEDIDSVLAVLPADVEALRTQGYVFRNYLERKVEVLSGQWAEMRQQVSRDVERRSRELDREVARARSAIQAAQGGGSDQINRAESALRMLESKVSAAQDTVEGMYDALDENVTQTQAQAEQIAWALEQASQASFGFLPAEDLVMASPAQLLETKKDGPEGVLFLTDERLVFERKEKVATKKVLFIATEKETVQEELFAIPIGQVEEVKTSQAGLLGHKELLELIFSRQAPLSGARLRLRRVDNEEWATLLGRVRSGEIAQERTQPKGEAAAEEARQVPTKCPTCGAQITVTVVKGMREMTCEYCSSVIRL